MNTAQSLDIHFDHIFRSDERIEDLAARRRDYATSRKAHAVADLFDGITEHGSFQELAEQFKEIAFKPIRPAKDFEHLGRMLWLMLEDRADQLATVNVEK
jgi:hypothetical protein